MQDFLELRVAVGDLVGNRSISDMMVPLTKRAEIVLNRRLRTMWQIDDFTPSYTDDVATLPADFLQLVASNNYLTIGAGTLTRRPYYTCPDPIEYYASLPTITTGPTATNWLLTQYENAYLYCTAVEAAKHLRQAELAVSLTALLEQELKEIKIEDDRARYSNRVVRVVGLTP